MLQEEEGPSDAFVQKVEKHVVKWFYRHISSFDRSVAEYINMRETVEDYNQDSYVDLEYM